MVDGDKPWWADDPDIAAACDEAWRWLESAQDRPMVSTEPDPVAVDFFSGASIRELAAARDDVERARRRYADAVQSARLAGLSWGEIGRLLGVPKQSLHRRFRDTVE